MFIKQNTYVNIDILGIRMCLLLKGIFLISFLHVCFSISVQGLVKYDHMNDTGTHVLTQFSDQHGGLRSEGIFERFLRNVLDLLSNFPERKVIRYCRVVSRELDKLDFEHTKQLAKHFRYLSRMYREEIKQEMNQYRNALDKSLQSRTEFLQAMNEAFTLRENQLFGDYVHDLKDYGNEDKLFIDKETGKVLNDVIVRAITKLSERDRRELLKKMKKAINELRNDIDPPSYDASLTKYIAEF